MIKWIGRLKVMEEREQHRRTEDRGRGELVGENHKSTANSY